MPPENRRRRQGRNVGPDTTTWSEGEKAEHRRELAMNTPLAEAKLSVRTINVLESNGMLLVRDLMLPAAGALASAKNLGDKTLAEIGEAFTALGLTVPAWVDRPKPRKPARKRGGQDVINFW